MEAVPKFNLYVRQCSSEPQSPDISVPPIFFPPRYYFLQVFVTKILYEILISLDQRVTL